ncbi:hypothetical protein [Lacicoccus qingdaonensis]|uniref:Uncharacterized protein n=1 Tax=Lacicoccus qingdaonensis TaxID=576118 RepID=A0A1G9FVZ9_9BACL|nr:hypothetical protein [Salinicoccus qingdaonensis]SDK92611.1 hypothetical protein SAMN05216216_11435 [Salinicoccus qingdaonensis]
MNFKKYLLAGGLASVLVLGACGGDEDSAEDTGGEGAGDTEETSGVEDEESSDSAGETIEESGEEPDSSEQ